MIRLNLGDFVITEQPNEGNRPNLLSARSVTAHSLFIYLIQGH
jgi:hypothetical protein